MLHFTKESPINATPRQLWRWHLQPDAFDKLVPPWQKVKVLKRPERFEDGAILVMKVYAIGPVGMRWVAKHRDFIEGEQFVDEQLSGPFRAWVHTHQFVPADPALGLDEGTSILRDSIEYDLPLGPLGAALGGGIAERMLEKMFDYRHKVTAEALDGR
ncbi:SRPBCC family protein [Bradymonas sediminis]|uniref:Cyclase n=1 Tax=Bradymonas sediminis TaxID=1548548 RepID=A0A2Z4FGU0_9DELT|nr:SRPBCC family protein [Bradymonas sediminis]AWV87935.1 cyclase [Bradymonas sediminis]TDP62953.1 ligand-binding SRPBCC domain-containing protein [Bradymonas sediminis]